MKIAIGNDHAAVAMKNEIVEYLTKQGHEVVNFGTDTNASTSYPIYAEKVSKVVLSGECERGILICGTGIGISIAANKIKGVRCAHCADAESAKLSRQHNNANIVAFGARIIGAVTAQSIVDAFINTDFDGGRHQLRIDMITELENNQTIKAK